MTFSWLRRSAWIEAGILRVSTGWNCQTDLVLWPWFSELLACQDLCISQVEWGPWWVFCLCLQVRLQVRILVWVLACELSLGLSCCHCCHCHCLHCWEVQDQDLWGSFEMLRWGLDSVWRSFGRLIYDGMADFGLAEASFFAFLPWLMVSVWKVGLKGYGSNRLQTQ